jgi:hypothetical protein
LRDRDWAFFEARFEAEGVTVHCITLAAKAESILGPGRDREFSAHEQARIEEMIAQGYARRPFSDVIVETDRASLAATAEAVVVACQDLMDGKSRD